MRRHAAQDDGAVTAVEVGEQLKAAGAPITRPIRDTTFESRWADYPGLSTDAETASRSLDLAIEVYDTAADRKWASTQQDANLAADAPYSTVKAECGVILVSGIGSKKASQAAAQQSGIQQGREGAGCELRTLLTRPVPFRVNPHVGIARISR